MNKKLIFRIFGALASALMIVGVFTPFVSVSGYSQSLWQTYEAIGTLYLPIMIMVFGLIGVLFFSLNIKTEFAYMSAGAIIFFVIMQTLDIMEQNMFNTLSVGYYCLAIGAIVTGIMAFLTNLKSKNKIVEQPVSANDNKPSMINQIDKLYDDTNNIQNVVPTIQPLPVEPSIQPIPEPQLVESIQPIPEVVPINPIQLDTIPKSNPVPINTVSVEPLNNISDNQPQHPNTESGIINQQLQVNPAINTVAENPVIQQFTQTEQPTINPVHQFTVNEPRESISQVVQPQINKELDMPLKENPVVQQFTTQQNIPQQQNNSINGLDIFGQSINK